MFRELTKSAISFSWALSLLGLKQAVNLARPGQQNRGNLFAPVTQAAVGQLDESMKGMYRSADNMGGRAVDMAFSWMNPLQWLNPSNMGMSTNPSKWMDLGNWINPMKWMNPRDFMRNANDCGCGGQAPQTAQPASPPPSQPFSQTGPSASAPPTGAPATSAAAGWGPMPNS